MDKELRKKAMEMDVSFRLGKEGVTNNFLKSVNEYMNAHKMAKVKVNIAEDKDSLNYYSEYVKDELYSQICFKRGYVFVLYREEDMNINFNK